MLDELNHFIGDKIAVGFEYPANRDSVLRIMNAAYKRFPMTSGLLKATEYSRNALDITPGELSFRDDGNSNDGSNPQPYIRDSEEFDIIKLLSGKMPSEVSFYNSLNPHGKVFDLARCLAEWGYEGNIHFSNTDIYPEHADDSVGFCQMRPGERRIVLGWWLGPESELNDSIRRNVTNLREELKLDFSLNEVRVSENVENIARDGLEWGWRE